LAALEAAGRYREMLTAIRTLAASDIDPLDALGQVRNLIVDFDAP
jgi:hypothetical protein